MSDLADLSPSYDPNTPGGDPAEVRSSDSHAESQARLNGPGGSPTSSPGRGLLADQNPSKRWVVRNRKTGIVVSRWASQFDALQDKQRRDDDWWEIEPVEESKLVIEAECG